MNILDSLAAIGTKIPKLGELQPLCRVDALVHAAAVLLLA
jgi:hypothetical protein